MFNQKLAQRLRISVAGPKADMIFVLRIRMRIEARAENARRFSASVDRKRSLRKTHMHVLLQTDAPKLLRQNDRFPPRLFASTPRGVAPHRRSRQPGH